MDISSHGLITKWNLNQMSSSGHAMAVLFRTEMHVGSLENGGKFCGCQFFALLIVMFNGMAELVLTAMTLPMFCKH
nr:AAA+ ATPase domain-containing protein [Tanacetum cinerariifolium]